MNLFGMGPLEVAVIFLVAFLALGPGKSIEMARTAGKLLRDLRRTFDEVTSAVSLDDDDKKPPQRTGAASPPQQPPATSAQPFEPSSAGPPSRDDPPPPNPP